MFRRAYRAFANTLVVRGSFFRLGFSGAKAPVISKIMSRHFQNPFPSTMSPEITHLYFDQSQTKMSEEFAQKINNYKETAMNRLKTNLKDDIYESSCVFTGSAGVTLLHYLYAKKASADVKNELLINASKYLQIHTSRRPRVTFLCGDAGSLAIGAVIAHFLGSDRPSQLPECQLLVRHLENLWAAAERSDTPDEFLYGRAGYLFALLFVNKETQTEYFSSSLIKNIISVILKSGQKLATAQRLTDVPLMYHWHDSYYLGGAHGIAGILYLLLQVREHVSQEQMNSLVVPTIDWLLAQRYPSGNLPSSLGSRSDKLVQWCHGAPGFVQLCCLAYEVFKQQKYLDAALSCGEVVWERGLCKKGYSICHGVAGNAYTFLQLYQTTKETQHLYRAYCFAQWCIEERPGTEQHSPDAPASLFEGLAGRLYFITDLFDPFEAKFPGFTL